MSDDLVKPIRPPKSPFFIDTDGDIADADGWLICCPAVDVWENDKAHAQWVLEVFQARDRIAALAAALANFSAANGPIALDRVVAERDAAAHERDEWRQRAVDRCAEAEKWFRAYGSNKERADALAEKLERAVEALGQCATKTIYVQGRYVGRKQLVADFRATLNQMKGDTP